MFAKFSRILRGHASATGWGSVPVLVAGALATLLLLVRVVLMNILKGVNLFIKPPNSQPPPPQPLPESTPVPLPESTPVFDWLYQAFWDLAIASSLICILLFIKQVYQKIGLYVYYKPSTDYDDLYSEVARLTAEARKEIIIVNGWPDDSPENTDKGKKYFEELKSFVERGGRLSRTIQVPTITGHLSDMSDEEIRKEIDNGYAAQRLEPHFKELFKLQENHGAAVLHVAPVQTTSTFIIYDSKVILIPTYEGDPFKKEKPKVKLSGMFVIRDPGGHLVDSFMKIYDSLRTRDRAVTKRFLFPEDGSSDGDTKRQP